MEASLVELGDIRLDDYFHMLALAFFYYDHLITIDREIKYVWMRSKRSCSYWFLVNRYFLFSANIADAVAQFATFNSLKSCGKYSLARQLLLVVNQAIVSAIMTLRVHALYDRSRRVLGGLILALVSLASVTCWAIFSVGRTTVTQQVSGCHIGSSSARLAVAWESLFAYDSIVFALTLIRTWQAGREVKIRTRRLPITVLLLRDGAIYFAVMALANLANILTFYLCRPILRGGLSSFSSSMSVTMMSRLMLNLHESAGVSSFSTHINMTDIGSQLDCIWDFAEGENVGGAGPQNVSV